MSGDNFPADTRDGVAIIAIVEDAFGDSPSFRFETLDLDGHGVRGMEWIPALNGYVIIGGPVVKANDYSLWRWAADGRLEPLELDGFDQLCRPESVIQIKEHGAPHLVVLSEESGGACLDAPFTLIKAEITDDGFEDSD